MNGTGWLMPVEVLDKICRILRYEAYDVGYTERESAEASRCDLAHLACCCRAYCDPALDVLWELLDSLTPLLRLLAPSITLRKNEFGYNAVPKDYVLSEELVSDTQWERFDRYAERVRILGTIDEMISPAIYTRLSNARERPVFPKLQELTWSARNYTSVDGFRAVITPILKRTEMYVGVLDASDAIDHLSHIQSDLPFLESLELRTSSLYSGHALSELACLRHLVLQCPITSEVFVDISTLPSLKTLCVSLEHIGQDDVLWKASLPELELLKMRGPILTVEAALRCISSSRLRSLTIELIPSSSWTTRPRLICAAVSQFKSTLSSLTIELSVPYGRVPVLPSHRDYDFHPRALEALFQIRGLISCALQFSTWMTYWTETDLRNWSSAWSHLEEIVFILRAPNSLRDLISFVSHFPNLRVLGWPSVTVRDHGDLEGLSFRPHPLTVLDVNFLLFEGPSSSTEVAEVLKRAFPNISSTSLINPPAIRRSLEIASVGDSDADT